MKAAKMRTLSCIIAVMTGAIIPCTHANRNCRETTSTQSLSCTGIRCKPDYTGGCNSDEYTKSSTQRRCDGTGEVGTTTLCYYDDVCCPLELWDTAENVHNDESIEWEDAWNAPQWGDTTQQDVSSDINGEGSSNAVGVAFAFVIIAVGAVYLFCMYGMNREADERAPYKSRNLRESGSDGYKRKVSTETQPQLAIEFGGSASSRSTKSKKKGSVISESSQQSRRSQSSSTKSKRKSGRSGSVYRQSESNSARSASTRSKRGSEWPGSDSQRSQRSNGRGSGSRGKRGGSHASGRDGNGSFSYTSDEIGIPGAKSDGKKRSTNNRKKEDSHDSFSYSSEIRIPEAIDGVLQKNYGKPKSISKGKKKSNIERAKEYDEDNSII